MTTSLAAVTAIVVVTVVLTAALGTTASASGSHSGSASRSRPGSASGSHKRPDVSSWTLQTAGGCETDFLSPGGSFQDAANINGAGDKGTYKKSKYQPRPRLTMTWTAGPSAGAIFKGAYHRSTAVYVGRYFVGDQSTGATVTSAATLGCAVITTTPDHTSIVLGSSVEDIADLTGYADNGSQSSPMGTVTFTVCPAATDPCTPTSSAALSVSTGGLDGNGGATGTTSDQFTPSAAGSYCYSAVYSGEGYFDPVSDDSAGECFTVTQATATVTTKPSSASITLGASETDTATVSGATGAPDPTGTVAFFVCGPASSLVACTSAAGTPVGSPVGLTPTVLAVTSAAFTPTATGGYCFVGVYSGDVDYGSASDGSTSDECFTVTPPRPPS